MSLQALLARLTKTKSNTTRSATLEKIAKLIYLDESKSRTIPTQPSHAWREMVAQVSLSGTIQRCIRLLDKLLLRSTSQLDDAQERCIWAIFAILFQQAKVDSDCEIMVNFKRRF